MIDRMRRIHRVHFIGIGGVGMGGIAEVLLNVGYRVQGSDLGENNITRRLTALGADVRIGHAAENVADADVVVVSSAVRDDNVELVAARERRCPIVPRAEMLGELMRFSRDSIAVAGTHGKTTTTSLVATLLAEAGLDPTFIIGGRLKSADSNARLGTGGYLVAEADESDASFMHLQPVRAIVTNVDADHLETYGGDIAQLEQSFVDFLHNLPFYGLAVLCADDPGVMRIAPRVKRAQLTYAIDAPADISAHDIRFERSGSAFSVQRSGIATPLDVRLNLPGRHNVLNTLAAVAIATDLDIADDAIVGALERFQGIDRRFQIYGEFSTGTGNVMLVDDYGHHPTELAATLSAARSGWPDRRLVLVFQPHRFTRTRDHLDAFAQVLAEVDALVLLDVYPAGEEPIAGADAPSLARAIRSRAGVEPVVVSQPSDVPALLERLLVDGDLLLTMGAGNIGSLAPKLAATYRRAKLRSVSS
ncbi:MAG: UDP-N-acetylmuramate--L-alanine ligase [Pseudomonadota bacterium]